MEDLIKYVMQLQDLSRSGAIIIIHQCAEQIAENMNVSITRIQTALYNPSFLLMLQQHQQFIENSLFSPDVFEKIIPHLSVDDIDQLRLVKRVPAETAKIGKKFISRTRNLEYIKSIYKLTPSTGATTHAMYLSSDQLPELLDLFHQNGIDAKIITKNGRRFLSINIDTTHRWDSELRLFPFVYFKGVKSQTRRDVIYCNDQTCSNKRPKTGAQDGVYLYASQIVMNSITTLARQMGYSI